MKTVPLTGIALLALLLANCSPSSTEHGDILARLVESRIAGRNLEKQPTGKDTITYSGGEVLALTGSSQLVSGYLVITIYEEYPEDNTYSLAVYAPDSAQSWKPVFDGELVPGKLDTIIDLNGDQQPEFIVDEYKGNSAGFNSVQALYARLGESNTYDRIDTLSHRYFGGSAYNTRSAKYTYEQQDGSTMIVVHTEKTDFGEEATAKVTNGVYLLYWQPPYLNRENEDPPPGRAVDLEEAQAILDELGDEERRKGLAAIRYSYSSGGVQSEYAFYYFAGALTDLKFRDYQLSVQGGESVDVRLEMDDNNVVKATKRIDGEDLQAAILLYTKDGQEYVIALNRHPTLFDSRGHPKEVPTNDIPGDEPAAASLNYEFDPENDKFIVFIRENAALFTPAGGKYVYEKRSDSEGTRYEVDSLLWVKEFANQ